MHKNCSACNKIFYTSPSRGNIKNCSYECNKVWRKQNSKLAQPFALCGCGCQKPVSNHRSKYVFGHHPQPTVRKGLFKNGHTVSRGSRNGNWRGGTSLMRNGYLQIGIDGKRKYLHRIIAAEKYGRELKPTEHVHHLDHDKLNNSPDNLVVLSPTEHAKYHSNVMWGNLTKGDISYGV